MTTPSPTIVKLGGAILADPAALDAVWAGVKALRNSGTPVVVVHGGGPQQTELAGQLGHQPRIVAGRRVTTDLDLRVALWTLRGELNARLVGAAIRANVSAVGISGADGMTVLVHRRPPVEIDGETVDFGHVGDVDHVEPRLLAVLMESGYTPVVASVCADAVGDLFNVNADTVAMELAVALGADRLELVTEAGSVRRDPDDATSGLATMSASEAEAGVADGWIGGGMRPKLSVAVAALRRGVPEVRIGAPAGLGDAATGTTITL